MRGRPQALIWALDLATVAGWAVGRVDGVPIAVSKRLAPAGSTSNVLFHGCYEWFAGALERGPLPDIVAIEELLPPTARRGATNTQTQHRLAGLHGIIRALAMHHGVGEIVGVNVQDVRAHFIHDRTLRRDTAKRAVAKTCEMLGWSAQDSNCSDALALWSYTAALINPALGLRTTPMFGSWEDVARARQSKQEG
jgi:hypothetical protein